MNPQNIGGVVILIAGLLIFLASMPVLKLIPRGHGLTAQVGNSMISWLARVFGLILAMLGVVTLLQP